jgi:hypothetical protein
MCIANFDEACALLKHGSSFGLEEISNIARGYLYAKMYPKHMWHAYNCAKDVGDTTLMNAAWKVTFSFNKKWETLQNSLYKNF